MGPSKFNRFIAFKQSMATCLMLIVLYFYDTLSVLATENSWNRKEHIPPAVTDSLPDHLVKSPSFDERPEDEIIDYLSKWELRKTSDGISVYNQWVRTGQGNKIRRILGDMIVDADASRMAELILKESAARIWIHGVENFYHIKKKEDNTWDSYVEFGFPWPFPNHDLVIRNHLLSDSETQVITIEMYGIADLIPEKDGIKRLRHLRGTWKLMALSEGRTKIQFMLFTQGSSKTPKWISDQMVTSGLINSLKNMRDLVSGSASLSQNLEGNVQD